METDMEIKMRMKIQMTERLTQTSTDIQRHKEGARKHRHRVRDAKTGPVAKWEIQGDTEDRQTNRPGQTEIQEWRDTD